MAETPTTTSTVNAQAAQDARRQKIARVFSFAAIAVGARALLIRTGIDRFLVARALVYVSITITFSCLVWLIVFRY